MLGMMRRLFIAVITAALTCCGTIRKPHEEHPYQILASLTVNDVEPLKGDSPKMEDLAFTFPVFELGAADTKKNIALGDAHVRKAEDFWQLLGDGAQTTITLERLTAPDVTPLIVRLSIGPVFDGVGARSPLHVYRFERLANGWRRLDYKIVEQAVSPNA